MAVGFLYGAGVLFLVVFAMPLLLSPLRWARIFQWELPEDTRLAAYFGRCLGAVAVALVFGCLRAARDPANHPLIFEILSLTGALLLLVHIWGAIRRQQPWTETAEIALYAVATGLAIWIRCTLP